MKRSQLLAASIVALMVLSAVPVQQVHAAGPYTEKLNVYVAGSDALWYFTFGGVNGSSKLSSLESAPGLNWYNITAVKTTGWTSDFQVFGPEGYNLLPAPFVPSQGLFLSVGSDSFADAATAASALGSYLFTSFRSYSNGTGTYVFYSPISFNDLVPATLLRFVPSAEGGFAKAITSTSFLSLASPFIVLEGVKASSGFSHTVVAGSISANALSSNQPNLMSYFGGSVASLSASGQSSSSVVQIRVLDGVIRSSDSATVTNNYGKFTSSYTLTLAAGQGLSKVNATVVQQPAPLLATRAVDVGVLRTGQNLSVTLSFTNLSPSTTITIPSFTDSWWNASGSFSLLSGSGSDGVSNKVLSPGGVTTPVYRVRYTGTGTGSVTIPASVVRYQYSVNGIAFNATAVLNPIRLSLGADDAVVYATISPAGNLGKPVGTSQGFNITVTNVGTLPASSVVVAGRSIAGLAAKSGSATVSVSQSATGLLGVNDTTAYSVTYQDPAGASLSATTNVITDIFSHVSMNVGYPELTASAKIASMANHETNLTLTYSASNLGPANVTSFKATGTLPLGLGCGKVSGKGLTCSGNSVTISFPLMNASSTYNAYMMYNLTTPLNYILAPLSFQGATSLGSVAGASNPVAVPAGMVVTKQFAPSQLFGGMGSTVTVAATNAGPLSAYNATLSSKVDPFDTVPASAVLTKSLGSVAPGGNVTLSYGVTVLSVPGAQTAAVATASFYFGGTPFSIQGSAPKVNVYQPLGATISTTPATPEEGKNFTITIEITNPTAVQVSDVAFTLPVPSGVSLSGLVNAQVSKGLLTVSAGTLAAHGNLTATAGAVASSGITVSFTNAKLTFSYSGATIKGSVPNTSGITIAENVLTRYVIPTGFILIAVFAVAFYVRRKAATAPASPK
ncbi:MAG: hypothetical protein JRN06_07005 [Nitrososphaerota archaeon]|nr:hypothetical protein [Nitrososphaerota archaeon]MDG7024471.1 hypothetical protein [Nitrososphaerota archaeon]